MANQFSILAKVKVDTSDIQSQLDNLRNNTITLHADTDNFELSISVANAVMREFIELAGRMVEEVYDLDKSLTEFKKVSDLRGSGLDNYVDQLGELGSTVARTTSDMVDAAAMFRKSGFTDAESAEMAQIASIFQNVADTQISAESAAASIVSQIQAFGRGMIEPIHIIDAYNNVANHFAVGTGDLSKAMELASAGLATYGNSFEEILGIVTSGSEILQGHSSQVARGLTTIAARIAGDDGKEALAEYGIEVERLDGSLRSTYEVLGDVAEKWGDLTDAQRVALGEVLAGKTRYNILAAVLQNFQHAVEATETAVNSSGSAMKENEAFMTSLQSKTTLLSATFQTLANDVIPKELVANALDLLNKALELLDSDLGIILTRLTLLTGIGWGMTSLVNASKVLPAVVGQIGNFTKLLNGATIVIPKAAAEVGGLTASLATFQAVSLPVIAIIAALGVAIYAIVEKAKKNKQAIDEMTSSAIQFKESIDNLNKSASEEKAKIETVATATDIYIKRIEELDKKSQLNNVEQAEYHTLLQKIVEIMPSVASSIDLQNDKIIGGTSAIYNQIEAWKKLAQQQAYQLKMSELYQNKVDMEFQLAELKVKLMQQQTELSEIPTDEKTVKRFQGAEYYIDANYGKRKQLENDIKNTEKAISVLESQLSNVDDKIGSAEQVLANIFVGESQNSLEDNLELFSNSQLNLLTRLIGEHNGAIVDSIAEESKQVLASQRLKNLLSRLMKEYSGDIAEIIPEALESVEEYNEEIEDLKGFVEDIKFSIDDYVSSSEKYISLLSSEYELLKSQGASQEEIVAKVKEIQAVRHEEAELLRQVLENAEVLELTQEDIYDINTKINECSIDWWNWQNKIKADAEEIKEDYEDISDVLEELFTLEKEELNTQKEAISALASQMGYYYDEQIEKINQEIDSLRSANEEIENQITLQQKLDALAKAKQEKVLVYKDGRFQYTTDIDAVSSASKDLADYQKQQELQQQIAQLEEQKNKINELKSSWSNMVSDYEKEQDRWLINQQLGINTAIEGWQRLVEEAGKYAEQYRRIMSSLSQIEMAEKSFPNKEVGYDPSVDYHALMLQAADVVELSHWAELREAKIKGEGITADKSTANIIRDWYKNHPSYAGGTLSANGGLSLVGEHGAELRVLNNGDGIIPSNMTSNLMAWGSMTPNQFKIQSLGNLGKAMQVTIQALNLPNVSDGIGFVDYVRNNMFGQVLSFVH